MSESVALVYLAASIIWTCAVVVTLIVSPSLLILMLWPLFFIPLVLLWANADKITPGDEEEMIRSGTLSVGIIVVVSLLGHVATNYNGSRGLMSCLIFLALILVLMSVPDYFFGSRWMALTRHIRIALQIIAIGVVALAVTLYYANHLGIGFSSHGKQKKHRNKEGRAPPDPGQRIGIGPGVIEAVDAGVESLEYSEHAFHQRPN